MAPVVDPLDGTLNESLPKREFDEFELACLFAARYPNLVDHDEIIRRPILRVATPLALYRLKKGTIRTQDHADAAALRERFNLKDEN